MADSRKSPRAKGSRPGADSRTSKGRGGAEKSGGKSAGGYGRSSDRGGKPRFGKPGDPRRTGGFGKPNKGPARQDWEKKAPPRPPREDDDFDFADDFTAADFADAEPAAFPEPARSGEREPAPRPARRDDGRDERRPDFRPGKRPGQRDDRRFDRRDDRRPARDDAERDDGKLVTAGRNPVRELLESAPNRVDAVYVRAGRRDAKTQEIVALADAAHIKVQFVDDVFLHRLYPGTNQGVAAVSAAVEYAGLEALIASVAQAPLPVLLALDQVQDPGNLGAMARTAWALGAAGIIVPRHGGAYIGAGAMRASAGALHHLPVARVTNMSQALDACAEAGLDILCTAADGEDIYTAEIDLPAVLVMGGEEKGVRFGVGKHCHKRLAIPLKRDFDSLNVAQAAAICLAHLGRTKR